MTDNQLMTGTKQSPSNLFKDLQLIVVRTVEVIKNHSNFRSCLLTCGFGTLIV